MRAYFFPSRAEPNPSGGGDFLLGLCFASCRSGLQDFFLGGLNFSAVEIRDSDQKTPDFSVEGFDDEAHVTACSFREGQCARCKWANYKDKWQEDLPWLDARMDMETTSSRIGCRLCKDAQQVSPEVVSKFPVSRHHSARYQVQSGEIRLTRL